MRRDQLADLSLFCAVAEERSFSRAAVKLGMSASAVSHSMKALEDRLGVRLLTRTTRSVSPTEAGLRLLETIVPAFEAVGRALVQLDEHREQPAGTIRITSVKHAAKKVLCGAMAEFLEKHPHVTVEITSDERLVDIVAEGYDAGVRLGDRADRDMISVRVSSEIKTAIVATPRYFERCPPPLKPSDLGAHDCIGHRMGTGALHPWPLQEGSEGFSVKVRGRFVVNDSDLLLDAVLAHRGLAYVFADEVEAHRADGRLVSVLDDWTTTYPGYYLFYPSRRLQSPALAALVSWLRTSTLAVRM